MENHTPAAPVKQKTPIELKLQEIWNHFATEFSEDPPKAFSKFLAKSGCKNCWGRGVMTVLNPEDKKRGELRLCGCALRHRNRIAEGLVKSGRPFVGPTNPNKPVPTPLPEAVAEMQKDLV